MEGHTMFMVLNIPYCKDVNSPLEPMQSWRKPQQCLVCLFVLWKLETDKRIL